MAAVRILADMFTCVVLSGLCCAFSSICECTRATWATFAMACVTQYDGTDGPSC